MNLKGISVLCLWVLAAVSARALEERVKLLPGQSTVANPAASLGEPINNVAPRAIGDWQADGAVLRKGFRGGMDYVVADEVIRPSPRSTFFSISTISRTPTRPATGPQGRQVLFDRQSESTSRLGCRQFQGSGSALELSPGPGSMFGSAGSGFRDFSIEFWLYPANADNGEVVLLWRSLRKLPSGVLAQQLSCVISGGRLDWTFLGFFSRPGAAISADADFRIELRAKSPLVPRAWSHHLRDSTATLAL